MRVYGGWEAEAGEYFFAEGRSAMAGMPPPVFSDRHQDQRKKEKKRTKRKERIIILLYIKRYLKDYYIYIILVCGESVVLALVHALRRNADSIGVWLVRVPVDLLVQPLVHTFAENAGFIGVWLVHLPGDVAGAVAGYYPRIKAELNIGMRIILT